MMDTKEVDDEFETTRYLTPAELKDLEHTLAKLDDVVFEGDWDTEFVEDMCRRVLKYGKRVVVTARQWKQLQRLKDAHL